MNILSQLLPGIREFRTPVAVGALWVLTIALGLVILPSAFVAQVGTAATPIVVLYEKLPGRADYAAGGLAIYLLGVAATVIGEKVARIIRVFTKVSLVLIIVGTAIFLGVTFASPGLALSILVILLLIAAGCALVTNMPSARLAPLAAGLRETQRGIAAGLPTILLEVAQELRDAWNPNRKMVRFFIREDLARKVEASSALLRGIVGRMSAHEKARAISSTDQNYDVPTELLDFYETADSRRHRLTENLRSRAFLTSSVGELDSWLEQHLQRLFAQDQAKLTDVARRKGVAHRLKVRHSAGAGVNETSDLLTYDPQTKPADSESSDLAVLEYERADPADKWELVHAVDTALDVPVHLIPSLDLSKLTWAKLANLLYDHSGDYLQEDMKGIDKWLTGRLFLILQEDGSLRRTFLDRLVEVSAYGEDVERRLEAGQVKLKIDQPGLYDLYDRLQAESEFRYGISLPVACAVSLISLVMLRGLRIFAEPFRIPINSWLEFLSAKGLSLPLGLPHPPDFHLNLQYVVAAAVLVAILTVFTSAGREKETAAFRLLYASIRQAGIVPIDDGHLDPRDFSIKRVPWRLFD